MADPDDLTRLSLATIRRSHDLKRLGVADLIERAPEACRAAPVVRIAHDPDPLPVADPLGPFTAELKLVARIINRPAQIRAHKDPVINGTNHLLKRRITGFEVEIGHPINRGTPPRRRSGAGNRF